MSMTIQEAYRVYRRITCHYEELDRIPEIFTDDFVGGNASFGQIRGLEAQTIFLATPRKMGMVPEDHLWCLIDGDDLAFRARNWSGTKYESPFFDVIGHLIFDRERGKFCFYHGFYDPRVVAEILGSSRDVSFEHSADAFKAAHEATERFRSQPGFDPALPDRLRVSSLPEDRDASILQSG